MNKKLHLVFIMPFLALGYSAKGMKSLQKSSAGLRASATQENLDKSLIDILLSVSVKTHRVKHILARGANPAARDTKGWTALHLCAINGDIASATVLLNYGCPIDILSNNAMKCSALSLACMSDKEEFVSFLLEHGADPDCSNGLGSRPFHLAITRRKLANLKLLALHGADLTLQVEGLNIPTMLMAAETGDVEIVQHVLSLGITCPQGFQALADSIEGDQPQIAKILREFKPASIMRCSYCTSSAKKLKKCARCKKARYCNAECQKNHWTIHKLRCSLPESQATE